MKIVLGEFNVKVGREDTFKSTIENESLHEISNDNGVRAVNFATSKNHTVIVTFIKLLGRLLMGGRTTKVTIF
jgi:hypothetical protein